VEDIQTVAFLEFLHFVDWQLPTFGTNYRSHPQGRSSPRRSRNVGNYQSTLHNIPEERRSRLHKHGGSMKPRMRSTA